jgi:hypothetical protein
MSDKFERGQKAVTERSPALLPVLSQVHPSGKPGCELRVARGHRGKMLLRPHMMMRSQQIYRAHPGAVASTLVQVVQRHDITLRLPVCMDDTMDDEQRDAGNPHMKNLEHTHYLPVLTQPPYSCCASSSTMSLPCMASLPRTPHREVTLHLEGVFPVFFLVQSVLKVMAYNIQKDDQ